MDTCPICGSPLINDFDYEKEYIWIYNCYRCGKFKILNDGINVLYDKYPKMKLNNVTRIYISGWIREKQDLGIVEIYRRTIQSLISLPELSVFEKADKMLQYLAKKFPVAGTYMPYEFHKVSEILGQIEAKEFPNSTNDAFYKRAFDLLPLIAIGRIIAGAKFNYIWENYLINEKHYISKESKITPAGWAYLDTFRHPNPDSKKAFVAMWFTDEMEEIYDDYMRKAIEDAGYKPIQIGRKEHNNDINDEIIGEIRNSKFVVADFTGNRGGVYYEAGFANGLNIEVIHTCRKDHLKDVHFDINHRNIIVWENGEDLYEKLLNKIKATIG